MKKDSTGVFFFIRILILLLVLVPQGLSKASAFSEDIDAGTGIGQAFTDGYSQRTFGGNFYETSYKEINAVKEPSVFLTGTDKGDGGALWQAHGGFGTSVGYDSNPGSAYNDEDDDSSHSYSANWGITRREKKTFFSQFYSMGWNRNIENSKSNAFNQNLNTNFRYKGHKFSADFSNSFTPGTDYATGNRTELEVDGKKRVRTISDTALLNLIYQHSKKTRGSLAIGYDNFYFPVADNAGSETVNGFSYLTYKLTPKLSYQWTPKTELHAQWLWSQNYYYQSGTNSSSSYAPSVGFGTRLGSKTSVGMDIGYEYRSYKDNILATDGYTISAGAYRQLTSKIGGSVYYTRTLGEDFNAEESQSLQRITHFYGLNLGYQLSRKMRLETDASMGIDSNEGFITLPDIENGFINHVREQEDVTYQWGVDWRWQPRKYVEFSLGYKFLNKNSSFKDFEYESHKLLAKMDSKF